MDESLALITTAGTAQSEQHNKTGEPEDLIRRGAIFTGAHPSTATWDLLDCGEIGEENEKWRWAFSRTITSWLSLDQCCDMRAYLSSIHITPRPSKFIATRNKEQCRNFQAAIHRDVCSTHIKRQCTAIWHTLRRCTVIRFYGDEGS